MKNKKKIRRLIVMLILFTTSITFGLLFHNEKGEREKYENFYLNKTFEDYFNVTINTNDLSKILDTVSNNKVLMDNDFKTLQIATINLKNSYSNLCIDYVSYYNYIEKEEKIEIKDTEFNKYIEYINSLGFRIAKNEKAPLAFTNDDVKQITEMQGYISKLEKVLNDTNKDFKEKDKFKQNFFKEQYWKKFLKEFNK